MDKNLKKKIIKIYMYFSWWSGPYASYLLFWPACKCGSLHRLIPACLSVQNCLWHENLSSFQNSNCKCCTISVLEEDFCNFKVVSMVRLSVCFVFMSVLKVIYRLILTQSIWLANTHNTTISHDWKCFIKCNL